MKSANGGPDPTTGGEADVQASWYLDGKNLKDNIKKILSNKWQLELTERKNHGIVRLTKPRSISHSVKRALGLHIVITRVIS